MPELPVVVLQGAAFLLQVPVVVLRGGALLLRQGSVLLLQVVPQRASAVVPRVLLRVRVLLPQVQRWMPVPVVR